MKLLKTIEACRRYRREARTKTLALVPTMGALHHAHMALVQLAQEHADQVVVSIFVNPLQFGPNEDFDQYPRPLEADLAACEQAGVDAVFLPSVEMMYPDGGENLTQVIPPAILTDKLCGVSRPGHFTGVATVVLKLFNLIQPDLAVFGEKDAQQLAIIRKMVRDLNLPVEIIGHPTVRDKCGLAVSSRNNYLKTEEELKAALAPSLILHRICEKVSENPGEAEKQPVFQSALSEALSDLNGQGERFRLEYLEAVNRHTFETVETLSPETKILIAGKVGNIRLIDNMDLDPASKRGECLPS